VAALDEAALVRALERPPRGLNVLLLDGLVGVVEVEPDTELPELLAHDLHMRHRKRPALFDERGDPVLFDIFLGGEAELVLDLHLDGEAVHVVAGPLDDVCSPHPVVAEDGVFYDLVPGGAEVDVAGGVRRSVDEKERFSILSHFLDACIDILPLPVILDFRLKFARVITAGDLFHLVSLIFSTLVYRLFLGDKVFCATRAEHRRCEGRRSGRKRETFSTCDCRKGAAAGIRSLRHRQVPSRSGSTKHREYGRRHELTRRREAAKSGRWILKSLRALRGFA
jgi:hypothetical protein